VLKQFAFALAFVVASALAAAAGSAADEGQATQVAGALVAMVIGETCPDALTANETAELKRYVDHAIALEKAKGPDEKATIEGLVANLDADYRSNRTCGVGDVALAKDMLQRIRHDVESIR
jgi:hypothetical protein